MFNFELLAGLQIIWILLAVLWLVRQKDELPIVISGFFAYVFSFRYWVIQEGLSVPVDISPFGFVPMTLSEALATLNIAILGQSAMMVAYMATQRLSLETIQPRLTWKEGELIRKIVVYLVIICMPLVFVTRNYVAAQSESGKVIAFQVSNYAFLFPMMLSGLAILVAALWKAGQLRNHFEKAAGALLLLVIAKLTFSTGLRFQFLGWILGSTFIFTAGLPTVRRVGVLAAGAMLAVAMFTLAGALRSEDARSEDLQQKATDRFAIAEDANMLDGFQILRQVYPSRLDYSMGMEHLEILLRPIPRAWWPDKPVGGYMNKLGLTSVDTGSTLGISPSLLGSFYQEGGIYGMILIAVIYGIGLGKLVIFSATRMQPFAGILLRGVICAFLIPLLRGGDLPGNYAWLGMAFWPCFLVLWIYRHEWFYSKQKRTGQRWGRSRSRVTSHT